MKRPAGVAAGLVVAVTLRQAFWSASIDDSAQLLFVAPVGIDSAPDALVGAWQFETSPGTRKLRGSGASAPSLSGALVATAGATALLLGIARGARTQRRGKLNNYIKDFSFYTQRCKPEKSPPLPYLPGQKRVCSKTLPYEPPPPPARMALGKVSKAMARYAEDEFQLAPTASLVFSDVKQVGTYMVPADSPEQILVPAKVPAFVPLKSRKHRLEQDLGPKRPPVKDDEYESYANKLTNLGKAAQTTSANAGFKLEQRDFVADRECLLTLMQFVNQEFASFVLDRGQAENPLDIIKISKIPGGKGFMLENLWDDINLNAERRPYNGSWRRSEISHHGSYLPAWQRLAYGDTETKFLTSKGLEQIMGSRAGVFDKFFRFVEFKLGGLDFVIRAPTHAMKDGKNVELATKNWYFRNELYAVHVYWKLLLGGVDLYELMLQRSGKVVEVAELSVDSILAKEPALVEVTNKRLGRVAELLKQVQQELTTAGEGPWVLQCQGGELVLGKYEKASLLVEA